MSLTRSTPVTSGYASRSMQNTGHPADCAGSVGVAACCFGLVGPLSADDTIVTLLTGYSAPRQC